jgi:hypothetical protein
MLDIIALPIALIALFGYLKRWQSPRHLTILLALSLPVQAQVYKWTDADGQIHYGNTPPPADAQSTQTLDITSQPTPAGEVDNVRDLQRATRELRELRAVNRGVSVKELDRPATGSKKGKTKEPPYIGYEDRARIDNLNSDIRRLSSSTIGTPASRARELRAAKDELRQIYRKYGIKPP